MLELIQNSLWLIISNDIAMSLSRTVCSVLILKCERIKNDPC